MHPPADLSPLLRPGRCRKSANAAASRRYSAPTQGLRSYVFSRQLYCRKAVILGLDNRLLGMKLFLGLAVFDGLAEIALPGRICLWKRSSRRKAAGPHRQSQRHRDVSSPHTGRRQAPCPIAPWHRMSPSTTNTSERTGTPRRYWPQTASPPSTLPFACSRRPPPP